MHFSTSLLVLSTLTGASLAARSAGCGKTPDIAPGHHHLRSVQSARGGGSRDFIAAIPQGYDAGTPAPLILSFHGNGKNATNQLYLSDFWNEAWNSRAISVYPQGVDNRWTGAPYDTDGPDDLAFTADLIDRIAADYCVDTARVYCSGKSLGGGFCNVLACDATLSARFAAIAPVSGAYYTTPEGKSFTDECHPARGSMPVLEFHGTADETISYDGGDHNGVDLRTIPDWTQQWADLNGCKGVAPTEEKSHDGNVHHFSWSCASGPNGTAAVQHYAIDNLGHTWPSTGSNPDNDGHGTYLDATPLIVEFFNQFSLDEAESATSTSSKATASTPSSTSASPNSTCKKRRAESVRDHARSFNL